MRENWSSGFPTRSDTNQPVPVQKMTRGLKCAIQKVEGLYYPFSEIQGADQLRGNREADLRVTAKLICVFVFAYTKILFSYDVAHILSLLQYLDLGMGRLNSCRVVDICLVPRVNMPCRTTGCCGMSMSMAPIDTRAELWPLPLLITVVWRP